MMKSLKQVLEASLLDIDSNLDITDSDIIKDTITQFINDNYKTKEFTISKNPNKDGKYKVSSKHGVEVKNKNITSLTNDLFVWNEVGGYFYCHICKSLQSLEGAPKEVGGDFYCSGCRSLKSLKGAPEKVGSKFDCSYCDSLKSLEGAPKEVGGNFDCAGCKSLQSLEGAPKEVGRYFYCNACNSLTTLEGCPEKVGGGFYCSDCISLKSLKDAPKEVGGDFDCYYCEVQFKESDVISVSNVKGKIYV